MPNQPNPLPPVNYDTKHWEKLLEETRAEYWNEAGLTEAEKRFLDDLQLVVHSGLELEDHTAVAEGLRLENYVPLAAIGDGVT